MSTLLLILLTACISIGLSLPFIHYEPGYNRSLAVALSKSYRCSVALDEKAWLQVTEQKKIFINSDVVYLAQERDVSLAPQRCKVNVSRDCLKDALKQTIGGSWFFDHHIQSQCKDARLDLKGVEKRLMALEKMTPTLGGEVSWRIGLLVGFYRMIIFEWSHAPEK